MPNDFLIKPNDYKRPVGIRRNVVLKLCEYFLEKLDDRYDVKIGVIGEHPELYIGTRKEGCNFRNVSTSTLSCCEDRKQYYDYYRISSNEMRAALDAMQDAGYYVYEKEGGYEYTISKRPYLGLQKATRVTFNRFID